MTVSQCEEEIRKLQAEVAPKIKKLAQLTYNEAYDIKQRYLNKIQELQHILTVLNAAEPRWQNKLRR